MDNSLYAFCDQDDVWNSEKFHEQSKKIQKSPNLSMTLHFSRVVRVDAKLKLLHLSSIPKYISFGNAVCEPAVLGCSTVSGREIKQMFTKGNPNNMIGHDWWIYLLATAFGHVIYDKEPQILYRRHDGNTSLYRSGFMLFKFKSKEFIEKLTKNKRDFDFLCQAKNFTKTYNSISADNKKITDELFSAKHTGKMLSRLSCAVKNKIFYNTLMEDFFLKLTIIFGCY